MTNRWPTSSPLYFERTPRPAFVLLRRDRYGDAVYSHISDLCVLSHNSHCANVCEPSCSSVISRGWRVVVLKPRSRLATGRVRPTGGAGALQVPRQRVEIDIATGENDADTLASDVDLAFHNRGIRNGR